MKIRNRYITSNDQEYLATIRKDYIEVGFDTALEGNTLIVYAKKQKKTKSKKDEKRGKHRREDA